MKAKGVDGLPEADKNAANEFFDTLSRYGVFVTRKGELERWLASLNVPGKKTEWTIAMLDKMGSDPGDASYVKPTTEDVWDFVRSIVAWIKDPSRKGTI